METNQRIKGPGYRELDPSELWHENHQNAREFDEFLPIMLLCFYTLFRFLLVAETLAIGVRDS